MTDASNPPDNGFPRKRKGERRGGDRRSGSDRRVIDLGPPDGVDRRTGWERRISDRRVRGDRRAPPRPPPTRATPQGVMLGNLRLLVSRLYHHAQRATGEEREAEQLLAELRTSLLRPEPDLTDVAERLNTLEGGALADLQEFRVARELLAHVAAEGPGAALGNRELVALLREILQRPLPPKPSRSSGGKDRSAT